MEPEERKISVWICQEEKLISGLSRRTTCSDVVRVLLEDSHHRRQRPALPEPGGGMLSGPPHSYCIVEKWRGFERILPNKTKILRLWVAWGDEQENVRFVLVRSEASLPNAGPRSAEARVVLSKERPVHGLGAARASLAEWPGKSSPCPVLEQSKAGDMSPVILAARRPSPPLHHQVLRLHNPELQREPHIIKNTRKSQQQRTWLKTAAHKATTWKSFLPILKLPVCCER